MALRSDSLQRIGDFRLDSGSDSLQKKGLLCLSSPGSEEEQDADRRGGNKGHGLEDWQEHGTV